MCAKGEKSVGNSLLFIGKAGSVLDWPAPLAPMPAPLSLRRPPSPLVDGDVKEDGDLSLEAMEDEEVALVDGVFEGAFGALADEWWCVGDGVLVSS
ncbi:hypothetical protein Tco_0991580 [Tanacetum coccineum]|uniref:Uncharacterized protein n=1 Tax=Tanacetum coccineum TaxID=301880 RepID=A0ABQ5EZM8_9ASTR